jgi:hypothetical protein
MHWDPNYGALEHREHCNLQSRESHSYLGHLLIDIALFILILSSFPKQDLKTPMANLRMRDLFLQGPRLRRMCSAGAGFTPISDVWWMSAAAQHMAVRIDSGWVRSRHASTVRRTWSGWAAEWCRWNWECFQSTWMMWKFTLILVLLCMNEHIATLMLMLRNTFRWTICAWKQSAVFVLETDTQSSPYLPIRP